MQSYHSNRGETERTKRRAQHSAAAAAAAVYITYATPASQRCSSNARLSVFFAADGELSRPTGRKRHSSTTRRVQRPTSGRRKIRATPTPTSRGRRSSNALDLVYQIIKEYSHLTESGKRILICWIPSHVNMPGNEEADSTAKSALSLPITKMKISATEYIPGVSRFCLKEWQDILNCCEGNKLHAIYPNVGRIPVPARCSGH